MDPIQALLRFLRQAIPFVPIPSEDQVLKLLSGEGNAALKARFAAQAQAVAGKLASNRWIPLPSTRLDDGRWHTLIASVLYYIAEVAVAEHGLENLVAGGIQGFYLQQILARVDPALYNVPGRENELIAAVGDALADLICPTGPETAAPAPAPEPTPAPAPGPEPAPEPAAAAEPAAEPAPAGEPA